MTNQSITHTDDQQAQGIPMHLRYAQASDVHAGHVQLFGQLNRTAVQFSATVAAPLLFRDTLSALFAVVSSDYRYVPKDRSVYAAYLQMRRGQQHQGLFTAQRAYFDWLLQNDPLAFCMLDPVIHVHPKGVTFEVFSRDEGCYATLTLEHSLFEHTQQPMVYGTTHIDYSEALAQGIEQIRSQRTTRLEIGQQAVGLQVETVHAQPETQVIEKKINVPASWLRGLLQVQSAAQLSHDRFALNPIDLYNVLHHLRMHADIKGKRRGLVIELIPQRPPSLIIEPSGTVINSQAAPYQGKQAKLIRIWGRRRLALLARVLPYADQIEVSLLGQGMPSYWTLTGQGFHFSLAITGFTASNWSQALNFDLLMPRDPVPNTDALHAVLLSLQQRHNGELAELSAETGFGQMDCQIALQHACQQGLVMFDVANGQYRYRPLTDTPLDMAHFRYRHPAEQHAYDLVSRAGAIHDLQVLLIPTQGVEVSASIDVIEDQRSYLSKLKLNEEGMVSRAECSCHAFLQHGLAHGPCAHLIALRMAYAHQSAHRDPNTVLQETRILSRRRADQIEQIQITLNHKRLWIQTGHDERPKRQQLVFNANTDAQQAYQQKIKQLKAAGFIENTVG